MNEVVTSDGLLARDPESGGLALALDEATLSKEAVNDLTSDRTAQTDPSAHVLIGRSALGIMGIDIWQERPAISIDGSMLTPLEAMAHTAVGQSLLDRLHELAADTDPFGDQAIRWDGHALDLGRLLFRGGLEQLSDDELAEAVDQRMIAFGDNHLKETADFTIEDGMLSLPIEPWELVPKGEVLNNPHVLRQMLQHGQSARAFAFENTRHEFRGAQHTMSKFAVGAVLFSPGPFYGEVVAVGDMPQLPSAAWFDANRSLGLHHEQLPGHRGRQFEVADPNVGITQPWQGARVQIKLFRPSDEVPADSIAQTHVAAWSAMSYEQRQDAHYFGYGAGV